MVKKNTNYTPDIKTGEDEAAFSRLAADFLVSKLEGIKNPLVVLPTGNTPLGMYHALVTYHGHRRDIWDNLRFLALDEYAGLQKDDPRLFYGWLSREFLDRAGIPEKNRTRFQSDAADPEAEVRRIENWLKKNGPIDVVVLGLGANGHIAFNEPGSPFDQPAHVLTLTPESIASNARYWGSADRVPKTAFTLGLGSLFPAKHTVLLVNGDHKAAMLERVLNGPVTTDIPATYLRTRPNVTVITDRAAIKNLYS
ncbi:MAG: glucosamine-6-phosphate deaminase [Micavibrio sp.]